jgi:diguanylate cyclase (GGDEF)-like protein
VFSEARLWGFVALEASGEPRGWEPSEIETVRTAATRLGTKIELSNLAVRDPLTGMYNRRYLDESLAQTLARAERDGTPLAVIQFDIDDFKGINDRLGHASGDSVLRELAERLRQHTRTQDTAARIGGDEFLVVMPGATADQAAESAERWRRLVESDSATWDVEGNPTVTISAGISSTSTAHTNDELLAQSDHAMFDAKNAGRNRVLRFG